MKRIFFALFTILCISYNVYSQEQAQSLGNIKGATKVQGRVYIDTALFLPLKTTGWSPLRFGAVAYDSTTNKVILWNGVSWNDAISALDTTAGDLRYMKIQRTLDSIAALRSATAAKLNITDAASTYTTITRFTDTAAAIQSRIQTKEPLLGFTPVPNTRTINGYALTGNITLNKSDVGLSNVPNTDATNATNITSGTLPDARLSSNVTVQGNSFNSANQLVKLDAGGKLPTSTIPSLALVETFVVGSQAAMLALSAQMGDVAVRTDNNRSYILQSEPASTLSNWVQLLVPDSETDPVYTASSWFSTTNNASNWNTAYSWGNHASAGYVSTSGSYSNPSWITALAWSKLTGVPSTFTPSAHTHTYADLTGTVPTWNQNTTGNAASATNSTQWNGYLNDFSTTITNPASVDNIVIKHTNGTYYKASVGAIQSYLGLGSNAYTSTAFLPLTGGSLSGSLAINGGDGIGAFNAQLRVVNNLNSNPSLIEFSNTSNGFAFGFNSSGTQRFVWINGGITEVMSLSTTGVLTASSFTGAGSGISGYAGALNIGGYSATFSYVGVGSSVDLNSTGNALYSNYSADNFSNRPSAGVYSIVWNQDNPSGSNGFQHYYDIRHGASDYGDLYIRTRNTSGWSGWSRMIHTNNYNSYSPTLTGTGASGTWGINITGNAATVTGISYDTELGWYFSGPNAYLKTAAFQDANQNLRTDANVTFNQVNATITGSVGTNMGTGILSGTSTIIRLNIGGTYYYLTVYPTFSPPQP